MQAERLRRGDHDGRLRAVVVVELDRLGREPVARQVDRDHVAAVGEPRREQAEALQGIGEAVDQQQVGAAGAGLAPAAIAQLHAIDDDEAVGISGKLCDRDFGFAGPVGPGAQRDPDDDDEPEEAAERVS